MAGTPPASQSIEIEGVETSEQVMARMRVMRAAFVDDMRRLGRMRSMSYRPDLGDSLEVAAEIAFDEDEEMQVPIVAIDDSDESEELQEVEQERECLFIVSRWR
jgi:hypothetical protein